VCIDDPNLREILPRDHEAAVTYGVSEDAAIRGIDIANEGGRMRFVARAANARTCRSCSTSPACTTC
jgi:UDP-N-acetylmuramate--alanine ligase